MKTGWFAALSSNVSYKKMAGHWVLQSGIRGSSHFIQMKMSDLENEKSDNFKKLLKGELPFLKKSFIPETLLNLCWIEIQYKKNGKTLFSFRPLERNGYFFSERSFVGSMQLDPYIYLRTQGQRQVLEMPQARTLVYIHQPVCSAWLAELAMESNKASGKKRGSSKEKRNFYRMLAQFKFLIPKKSTTAKAAAVWEFHDVLFHSRNRMSLHRNGRTNRFGENAYTIPEIKHLYQGRDISLHGKQPKATQIQRFSSRGHGDKPIDLKSLSRLLAVVAKKNYPSAGGIYENEFYIAVSKCESLREGLYRFDRENKKLKLIKRSKAATRQLLIESSFCWGRENGIPQTVIIITSRFPKIAQKYEGIAYRLSLLNAGLLLGKLDEACARLGLAGCILGSGSAALFSQATGISHFEETSIAEIAVGRRRDV